ncbi:MAG: branched-chain amino acid ABC transporter permease [Alphaproteobacteria bacterium]
MNFDIAILLTQDGLINGAVYALLAIGLVLIFTVTRIIFVPQGDFIAFGTLTLATLQAGTPPLTIWLLIALGVIAFCLEANRVMRDGEPRRIFRAAIAYLVLPGMIAGATLFLAPRQYGMWVQIVLTLAIVTPLGPILYRIVYQPIAQASVLILLIVSVAIHFVLSGLALVFFGAEGSRTSPLTEARFSVGQITLSGQQVWVFALSALLISTLYFFFRYTFHGKTLMATAVNRLGARLMGISPASTGILVFTLAAVIGCISGILIGPFTTIFYDTGFLIGLKGFVAAIVGALVSYPIAALAALMVGILESFSAFYASAYKEVIVFSLIIPILMLRSMTATHIEEDKE